LGYPAFKVLAILNLPRSSYYYKPRLGRKGNKPTTSTPVISGGWVSNEQIVAEIKDLLCQEFVDYGYKKVRWWLYRQKGYLIGYKKVYRLMKEAKLLLSPPVRVVRNKLWVKDIVPKPQQFFEHIEMDIKYIWVSGAKRFVYKLTLIDVRSRLVMAELVQESVKKHDVVALLDYVKTYYRLPETLFVRNDNGSQFISDLVGAWMSQNQVKQEFTRVATPEQNGHIEAYHSILERAICRRIELESVEHAKEVFERFHYFYNCQRIHSGIGYDSPVNYLLANGFEDLKSINADFYLRGWRLETSANKQVLDEGGCY
jgi:transposase InsO family protein